MAGKMAESCGDDGRPKLGQGKGQGGKGRAGGEGGRGGK